MSVLSIFKRADSAPPPDAVAADLSALLVELQRYGQPRLGVYGSDGCWRCSVEMNTNAVGVRFDAGSGFKHKTPTEAAIVCRDRIRAALAMFQAPTQETAP